MLRMRINGLSMIWRICGATLLAGLLFGTAALAQAPVSFGAILVTDAGGRLGYRIGEGAPQPVVIGQIIPVGARITTGPDAHLVLRFPDEQMVVLGPRSRLILREFRYLPRDLGNSRVLFNLTDGTVNIVMGEIGQHDPGLVQVQVGTKSIEQAPQRARGNDVGVIILGIATLVQVTQGKVSLLVASSGESYSLAAGARALVQEDGFVQMGGPPKQFDEMAGRTVDGKIMIGMMEEVQKYPLPQSARQTTVTLSTPPSNDVLDDLRGMRPVPTTSQPATGTVPTATTGAGGGGLPCTASCN